MDRRWSARKRLQLRVSLELPRYTEPVTVDLRDISLSGAYIETPSTLPHSFPLIIELHPPNSRVYESFRLQAHVVRRVYSGLRPRGAALMFLGTSADAIRALSEALARYDLTASADASNF
jgi:hypothetical protein